MDFAIAIENGTGRGQMTFNKTTSFMNNIYLSLMIRRGSFFADPTFGSRLYLLERAKNTDKTAQRVDGYCREALQWMIDGEKAKSVEVYVQRDNAGITGRIYYLVQVTPMNSDQPVPFSSFIEVI